MILIAHDAAGFVTLSHSQPFDPANGFGKTKEELEAEGYLFVDALPDPDPTQGSPVLRVKLEGEGAPLIFYTYEPLPEPEETQLEKAKTRIAVLESADLDNKEMIATLYELTLGGAV